MSAGLLRSHTCGELRSNHVGNEVTLCGWVNKYRDLGSLHFIDIRDRYGLTQLGFEEFKGDFSLLKQCSLESVILAKGIVRARPADALNKKMSTGEVEIQVTHLEVLSRCDIDNLPFLPNGSVESSEDLKLKYRYLDLRTKKLQDVLKMRSKVMHDTRNALYDEGFTEVETPILYKSTPEGARDYVVPSRVHPNHVYALPQSPQTLKQLLMIGGTDKYFQLCRCFRDEDLRHDRQPEFTQIDIEVSFTTPEYIKALVEKTLGSLFETKDLKIPSMSFQEAMARYGSDKPDVRFGLEHIILTELFKDSEFAVLSKPANDGGMVKAFFVAEEVKTFSRKETDAFVEVVKPHGGKGVAFFKVKDGERSAGISKFITDDIMKSIEEKAVEKGNGTWLFFADSDEDTVHSCADALRKHLGHSLELLGDENKFLWIYDFPLFEYSKKEGRLAARHHPFTMPKEEHLEMFLEGGVDNWKKCLANAYDVVCNGYELGGGSIRIHRNDIQTQMFKALEMSTEDTQKQFGFFLEALNYGVPPHGGLAFGLDRVIMIMCKTESIRDVIAFPKTNSASDLMSATPSVPAQAQLDELHMNWQKK